MLMVRLMLRFEDGEWIRRGSKGRAFVNMVMKLCEVTKQEIS
jgi:hypothetical protein